MKINSWILKDESGEVIEEHTGISIKTAKSLLKEKGGIAYSCQYRGGDLVGTTDITLGSNAKARKSQDASRKDVGNRIVNEAPLPKFGVAFEQDFDLEGREYEKAQDVLNIVVSSEKEGLNDIRDISEKIERIMGKGFIVGCGGSHIWIKRKDEKEVWGRWAFIGGWEEAQGWQISAHKNLSKQQTSN